MNNKLTPYKTCILTLIFFALVASPFLFGTESHYSVIDKELVEFGAISAEKRANKIVLLNWTTLKEYDAYNFLIERSTDGETFQEIGGIGASRQSPIPINYNYSDLKPVPGKSWYRIKVINYQGVAQFSRILTVIHNPESQGLKLLQAFPNPFVDSISIRYSIDQEGPISLRLLGGDGTELGNSQHLAQKGQNLLTLHPDSLPSGRYVLGIMGYDRVLKAIELVKR